MLHKIGLLPSHNLEQLQFAFAVYNSKTKAGLDESIKFKQAFSIDVRIKFLGVWYVTQPYRSTTYLISP